MYSSSLSIFCLTETRLTEEIQDSEITVDGYNIVRVDSDSRYTGGVVCYVHKSFKYDIIATCVLQRVYWMVVVKIYGAKEVFYIATVYRSPSSSRAIFLDFFEDWCIKFVDELKEKLWIVGDFNINWMSNEFYTEKLKRIIEFSGLWQKVDEITNVNRDVHSVIDLVFTNDWDTIVEVTDVPNISSHRTLNFQIELYRTSEYRTVRGRIEDFEEAREKAMNVRIDYRNHHIDIKTRDLVSKLRNLYNDICPLKQVAVKKTCFWFSSTLREMIKMRDHQYKRFMLTGNPQDWEEYRSRRNRTLATIRQEKQMYYEGKIDAVKGKPKEMWKTIKNLISSRKSLSYEKVEFEGSLIMNTHTMAEKFNNYFIESINKIVDSINNSTWTDIQVINVNILDSFSLLDKNALRDIISKVKSKSSPDDVCVDFIQTFFEEFYQPILHIMNVCLESGVFPRILKRTTVIPIKKVARSIKVEDFRPINMLPALEKILEKIVYLQLQQHLKVGNVLTPYQSGFREGHSCETALQCVISDWKRGLEDNKIILVIFLDLKRAFETIDRQILLEKLQRYGVRGTALQWFASYLADRTQVTKINEVVSDEVEVTRGVPQGSILGPFLFALYINDIVNILRHCSCHLFADDTVLYIEGEDVDEVIKLLNEDLLLVSKWLEANKLKLNVSKTVGMCLGSTKLYKQFSNSREKVKVDEVHVHFQECVKYLGVMIDRKLSFNDHLDYVCKKISRRLGLLTRLSNSVSLFARLTVFNTTILPYFHYCATVMYMLNKGDIDKLQKLQNRCMRTILKCSKYTPIREMLNKLQWMCVSDFIEYKCLIFLHKLLNGHLPCYFNKYMVKCSDIHNYQTRNKDNIYVDKVHSDRSFKSVFVKGLITFNKLDTDLKNTRSEKLFKIKLKQHYLNWQD